MILITVQDNFRDLVSDSILISAAEAALIESALPDSPSLLIRITDDEELKTLNLQYRGIDKTTDVLSFPTDFTDPDLETRYLGDVVIAYPKAEEQSQKRGHFVDSELQLLVVHGVLHLLGHDHVDQHQKEEMWSVQSRILDKLGLDIEVEDK